MPGTATPAAAAGSAVRAHAVGAQVRGEVEDRCHHRVGSALPAGGTARLVQQRAVRPDQGGLHPGTAHIEGDDMSHGDSLAAHPHKGLVHFCPEDRMSARPGARPVSHGGTNGRATGGTEKIRGHL